jgi:hypothetical protein
MGKKSGNEWEMISSYGEPYFLEHENKCRGQDGKIFLGSTEVHGNSVRMNGSGEGSTGRRRRFYDWREDLSKARDLTTREIEAYGYVLGWMEDWRRKQDLPAGRDAARRWWKEVAKSKERPEWQLRQWEEAILWFLGWLEVCE